MEGGSPQREGEFREMGNPSLIYSLVGESLSNILLSRGGIPHLSKFSLSLGESSEISLESLSLSLSLRGLPPSPTAALIPKVMPSPTPAL